VSDPAKALEELELLFTALSHPVRRQILLIVHYWGGSMTAGDLAGRFEHSWPTTTRHLQVLEEAGLLTHERIGRQRHYILRPSRFHVIRRWFSHFDSTAAATKRSVAAQRRKRAAI
jgi:DNA-binding transcriptional ArsR family regulator